MRGANLQARRLKLKALMPNVEMMQKTLGEMNGDASCAAAELGGGAAGQQQR
jgi:uncharacterized protein involved in outer membrane biogenesis